MSSNVLNTMFGYDVPASESHLRDVAFAREPLLSNAHRFGEEQIRSLVHQVFFPDGPSTPHQVVFSSADPSSNVAEICLQVGHTLAAQTSGNVCIVEVVSPGARANEPSSPEMETHIRRGQVFGSLRESALLLSKKLWLIPSDVFMQSENGLSAAWLRGRIDELRLDFEYTIFQAPPAGQCSDAPLLGHLCDGVVLVLAAHSTRRVAARKIKDTLFSANARLLGTVLANRRFPIPKGIYRRL